MASQASSAAAFSGLQEGALVLADISGYSKFIAQTEVDHSWSILHELLDTMVRSLEGRMDVSQVEGDAILFISGLTTAEVIAAHRLLKNSVPSKEYLLVTDAVLERLPAERRQRFHAHREEFDLGAISGGYEEIAHLWEEAQAVERRRVMPEEALVNSEVIVEAPIALVDSLMLKPDVMQRYLFSD